MATSKISKDKIIKYKDYTKTDSYVTNEFATFANLNTDGIEGYIPIAAVKISPTGAGTNALVPFIYNIDSVTKLMAWNRSGGSTGSITYTIRVYFVRSDFIE